MHKSKRYYKTVINRSLSFHPLNAQLRRLPMAAPEFFGCRAQLGRQNFDWGTFKKLYAPLLLIVKTSTYIVRMDGSTHGTKNSFM